MRPTRRRNWLAGVLALALSPGVSTVVMAQATAPDEAAPALADSTRVEQEKSDLIRELIALTDAAQLEALISQRFVDRVAEAIALFRPDLEPRTLDVIRQEATAVVNERIESGDALYSVLYPVYEKHFNVFELNRLVEFYESPLGQKLARLSPQLLGESLQLGQEWALSLVPEIVGRVRSRLNDAPDDQ